MNLKHIIERPDTPAGRIFAIIIQFLIVLSLIEFSLETLPNLSPGFRRVLAVIETFTIAVFTVEYVARLALADRKLRFVFSVFGLIDLLAILPFYMSLGIDLRALRAIRLLRLFRIFKLSRFSIAGQRLGAAFVSVRAELVFFFALTAILLYLAGMGIYFCEHRAQPEVFRSVFDGLWWAVASLTTVGYGDTTPITTGGKIFASAVLLVGLGVVAVPTGLLTAALSRARVTDTQEKPVTPLDEID